MIHCRLSLPGVLHIKADLPFYLHPTASDWLFKSISNGIKNKQIMNQADKDKSSSNKKKPLFFDNIEPSPPNQNGHSVTLIIRLNGK